jgi:DNA sulfur modification protein DndB
MKMAELANYVSFAEEIFPKNDLDQIMQREITERSSDIAEYLRNNDQRFMGALIVAAVGGEPKFVPISFSDDNIYTFAENKLGFLRFDGTEKYYALDGQHRLAAIREVLNSDSERFGKDEISLILVWHENNQDGIKRARRLFTTVNRYAKKTSRAEDLVFDEDNPVDIYTRRLVREHAFFKQRTKISNLVRSGEFRLSQSESLKPENSYDRNFLLSILTLRRCNEILLEEFLRTRTQKQVLPDFDTLEEGFSILNERWTVLLDKINVWKTLRDDSDKDLGPFRRKDGGNTLVRPIAIIAFLTGASRLFDARGPVDNISKVSEFLDDLTAFPWRGLLWKKDQGGMHDGQTRRNAAAAIYSYYLTGTPNKSEASKLWRAATGDEMSAELTERDAVVQ